jgi:hypothetical protein
MERDEREHTEALVKEQCRKEGRGGIAGITETKLFFGVMAV